MWGQPGKLTWLYFFHCPAHVVVASVFLGVHSTPGCYEVMKYVINHTDTQTHAHTNQLFVRYTNRCGSQAITPVDISRNTIATLFEKYIDLTDCTCITERTEVHRGWFPWGQLVVHGWNKCIMFMLFIFCQSQLGDHVCLCTNSHIHICIYSTYSTAQDNLWNFSNCMFL